MKNNNHKKSDDANRKNKKRSQQKKTGVVNSKPSFFTMLYNLFVTKGNDAEVAHRRAVHQAYGGENPIFYPSKHTVMGYAKQNRLAKQRRKVRV